MSSSASVAAPVAPVAAPVGRSSLSVARAVVAVAVVALVALRATAPPTNGEGGAITALPVLQEHGDIPSLGFRFGGLAYSCDLSNLPPDSVAALRPRLR